jgi:hypothetical protein
MSLPPHKYVGTAAMLIFLMVENYYNKSEMTARYIIVIQKLHDQLLKILLG